MRIKIDPRVANDPNAYQWLDRIVHKIVDGWHVWDTTNQPNPTQISSTTWIRGRGRHGKWVHSMLVASIQRAAWTLAPHGRSVRVTEHPSQADEFTPEDACRLVEEPLCILVENRESDGAFVERIVKELDPSLHSLLHGPGQPVRFDSVGGKGQMSLVVERRVQFMPCGPRLVAIIDSDRKSPGDNASRDARRLDRTCSRQCLPCWVLGKREAENYLPLVLLKERQNADASHQRRVAAWDRLTDDQKDFFDMKDGLSKSLSPVERRLFAGVSPSDRAILCNGFGLRVDACWTLWHVPAKQEIDRRGRGDLQRGIALIRGEV